MLLIRNRYDFLSQSITQYLPVKPLITRTQWPPLLGDCLICFELVFFMEGYCLQGGDLLVHSYTLCTQKQSAYMLMSGLDTGDLLEGDICTSIE